MDVEALQNSWIQVEELGDVAMQYFYSHLFENNPGVRDLFPADMAPQRARFFEGLGTIVASVPTLAEDPSYVDQLGRRHVHYNVAPAHYPAAGASLLATLAHFHGDSWTPELEQTWTEAFEAVAGLMIAAGGDVRA